MVPGVLRGEPQLGLRGDDLLDAVGPAGGARRRGPLPVLGERHQRLRRASDHASQADGSTATLVENSFGSASSNKLAATVAVLLSALLWGIGIGQIYQSVYARAWGIEVGSAADQALFAIFFFVFTGAIALGVVAAGAAPRHRLVCADSGLAPGLDGLLALGAAFSPAPQGRSGALLPGALLAAVVLGGATATSPLFLPATWTRTGRHSDRSGSRSR